VRHMTAQAVALGYAVPRSALDAVMRHGLIGVDSGSLYALGGVLGGALWLLLVGAARAVRDERIHSERGPIYAQGPGRRELSGDTDR
jgi:hypothetical protein